MADNKTPLDTCIEARGKGWSFKAILQPGTGWAHGPVVTRLYLYDGPLHRRWRFETVIEYVIGIEQRERHGDEVVLYGPMDFWPAWLQAEGGKPALEDAIHRLERCFTDTTALED
jgi:hypothetical protein